MPISVQVTKGLLSPKGEREVFPQVTEALLKVHGLSGNPFLAPAVAFVTAVTDIIDRLKAGSKGGASLGVFILARTR